MSRMTLGNPLSRIALDLTLTEGLKGLEPGQRPPRWGGALSRSVLAVGLALLVLVTLRGMSLVRRLREERRQGQ
jgi:hypothetical protein